MKFANAVNDLVVQFIRLDYDEINKWDMFVMERLHPLDYRGFEIEKRELIVEVFEDQLKQLHKAGFAHRDILRPSNISGQAYDNILLTSAELRLIDVGISALKSAVGEKLFHKYVEHELKELNEFKNYFLTR